MSQEWINVITFAGLIALVNLSIYIGYKWGRGDELG